MQRYRKVVGLTAAVCLAAFYGCGSPQHEQEPDVPTAPALSGKPGPVDPDAPEEFTTTQSGLKYRIRRKSDGSKPVAGDSVVANYRGWLDDGKVFDASYDRGRPFDFQLTTEGPRGVIPGWVEGMQLIGEGGMIELEIPPELGYRDRRTGDIPPNSTLHFLVELIEIQ